MKGKSMKTGTKYFLIFLTFFFIFSTSNLTAQPALAKLDVKKQITIIDSISAELNKVYVFPETAKKMEAHLRKNFKKGNYKAQTNLAEFCRQLTTDMREISKDKHLWVAPAPPPEGQDKIDPDEEFKQRLAAAKKDNFGFKKLEILPGNIGYVDFRNFADARYAGGTAVAAMNFLCYADAVIFDLRQNGGGSPSMIQLLTSYLFDESQHLNNFYIRQTDTTHQFWTQSWVPGPKLAEVPVYVLTSGYTFSGAEEFTYNMKNMKRGTIIGETTGGGAHPVDRKVFNDLGIRLSMPFGRAVNPISKTNWEGTGVEPDIKVPADKALVTAQFEIMKKFISTANDETARAKYEWILAGLEAEKNPLTLTQTEMLVYVGDFGPRHFMLENGTLFYQRDERPKYRLIPMGKNLFGVDGIDYFRVKFIKDQSGDIVEVVGIYDNGNSDSNPKDKK